MPTASFEARPHISEPRPLALQLAELGLPEHVGRGRALAMRTTVSACLFDLVLSMRSSNKQLLDDMGQPMRRPPQSVFEIGVVDGEITDANPVDRIALLRVGLELQDVGMLPVGEAVSLYLETRRLAQRCVRDEMYPTLGGATLGDQKGHLCVERRLLRYLPIARVPHCTFHVADAVGFGGQKRWHNAFITDAPSLSDAHFIDALQSFYKAAREKEMLEARGAPLTAEAFADIRACVGGKAGELLEFLVCKGFDDDSRRALGISDGRACSSISRYDAICSQLPALRRAAEQHVEAKGQSNQCAAVTYYMRRVSGELGLFSNEAQAAVAAAKRSIRGDPRILRTLQVLAQP